MINTETASYKELKAEIKNLCNSASTSVEAKAFFGNYTQMSTFNMRVNLNSWYKGKESSNSTRTASKAEAKVTLKEATKVPKTSKWDVVCEKLEKGDLTPTGATIDMEKFQEALLYVKFGINELLNCVTESQEADLVSDADLEALSKKITRR